jgi:hypothetical protein
LLDDELDGERRLLRDRLLGGCFCRSGELLALTLRSGKRILGGCLGKRVGETLNSFWRSSLCRKLLFERGLRCHGRIERVVGRRLEHRLLVRGLLVRGLLVSRLLVRGLLVRGLFSKLEWRVLCGHLARSRSRTQTRIGLLRVELRRGRSLLVLLFRHLLVREFVRLVGALLVSLGSVHLLVQLRVRLVVGLVLERLRRLFDVGRLFVSHHDRRRRGDRRDRCWRGRTFFGNGVPHSAQNFALGRLIDAQLAHVFSVSAAATMGVVGKAARGAVGSAIAAGGGRVGVGSNNGSAERDS